jgi:outer membrane biosynthesis protein TonB
LKIALGTLKEKGQELAAFLEPRVGTAPSVSGDAIEIEDGSVKAGVKPRHVKTYIKRFMYMNGVRKNYRVFVTGKELTIQEIELGEKEKKAEKGGEKLEAPKAPVPEESKEEAPKGEEKEEEPKAEKPKKSAAKKPRAKKKEEAGA